MNFPKLNFRFFETPEVKGEVTQILAEHYSSKNILGEALNKIHQEFNKTTGDPDVFTRSELSALKAAIRVSAQAWPKVSDPLVHIGDKLIRSVVAGALLVHDMPTRIH